MTPDDSSNYTAWAGWLVSGILWIGGIIASIVGWHVRGSQSEFLALKRDTHDAIDKSIKCLTEFEDISLSYWCELDSKVLQHNILTAHKRLVSAYKQVAEFKRQALPTDILSELRKIATIDFETAPRPISQDDPRVKKILGNVSRALDSDFLLKSWDRDTSPSLIDKISKFFSR